MGDVSIAIAVSAPHRQDALSACRDVTDELKERVPLWKKEVYEGGEEWIGRGSWERVRPCGARDTQDLTRGFDA